MTLIFLIKIWGSISIFCALYLYIENLKLKKQVRANSWLNYHRVNSTISTLNEVTLLYKNIHRSNLNTEVLEPLVRSSTHNEEFSKGVIHQIQMFEPSFEEKDFIQWQEQGKIDQNSLKVFKAIKLTHPEKKHFSEKLRSYLRKRLHKNEEIPSKKIID